MYIQYGNYRHDAGEVELSIERETLYLESQIPWAYRHRWTLSGVLVGSGQDDIDAKVRRLEAAYAVPRQDLVLYRTSGAPTRLVLLDNGSVDGVRVTSPPSYPSNRGAAYVTHLPYRITLEAEYPVDAAMSSDVVTFKETLQRSGGGPQRVVLETLETPPVFQQGRLYPAYRVTQIGEAVGLFAYPQIPPPLWPDKQLRPVQITQGSPQTRGNRWVNWPISWSYEFASAQPLLGRPHILGVSY